jgi:hypothetical protein
MRIGLADPVAPNTTGKSRRASAIASKAGVAQRFAVRNWRTLLMMPGSVGDSCRRDIHTGIVTCRWPDTLFRWSPPLLR